MLEVLASGHKPTDPARLLSSSATQAFFRYLRRFDYDYILVDGPPMLGIADTQALAREADRTLLVTQLDRLTADHVIDMGELIERLEMRPIGLVVIGARVKVSPYYLSQRPAVFDATAEQENTRADGCSRASALAAHRAGPDRAATSQKWRRCRVSTKRLFTIRPHQVPSSAAEPIPSGPAAQHRVARCQHERAEYERDDRDQPSTPCSANTRMKRLCAATSTVYSNCPGPIPSGCVSASAIPTSCPANRSWS